MFYFDEMTKKYFLLFLHVLYILGYLAVLCFCYSALARGPVQKLFTLLPQIQN